MSEKCNCGCCFTWLSGFFAAPAVCHIIRIIAGWDIMIKGEPLTIKTSWMIVVITGVLAAIFGMLACRKKKAGEAGPTSSCCS